MKSYKVHMKFPWKILPENHVSLKERENTWLNVSEQIEIHEKLVICRYIYSKYFFKLNKNFKRTIIKIRKRFIC